MLVYWSVATTKGLVALFCGQFLESKDFQIYIFSKKMLTIYFAGHKIIIEMY